MLIVIFGTCILYIFTSSIKFKYIFWILISVSADNMGKWHCRQIPESDGRDPGGRWCEKAHFIISHNMGLRGAICWVLGSRHSDGVRSTRSDSNAREQDWAGRTSDSDADLTKCPSDQWGALEQRLRMRGVPNGRSSQTLVFLLHVVIGWELDGKAWHWLKSQSEHATAEACQSTVFLSLISKFFLEGDLTSAHRASCTGVWPVQLHRTSRLEEPYAWWNALFLSSLSS